MGQSSFFLFLMINDTSPFYQIVTQQVPSIKNSRENGSKANLNRNKEFYYMILELEKIWIEKLTTNDYCTKSMQHKPHP